jgi:hypothetical protein
VLCLGMSGPESVLLDLLSELIAERTSSPAHFILLGDDPLINNADLSALLHQRSRTHALKGSLSDLLRTLSLAQEQGFPQYLQYGGDPDSPYESLKKFGDVICVVNHQLIPKATSDERMLLLDLLFAPSNPRWDAFAHNLDLVRPSCFELSEEITGEFATDLQQDRCHVLIGGAAAGKTTLLKRLAFELAKQGYLVLWQLPSFLPDPTRQLRALFAEVARVKKESKSHVVFILDDPASAGFFRRK